MTGRERAIGDVPNWEGLSSTELYRAATANNDPASADTVARAFAAAGERLTEAAERLRTAIATLDEAWTGVAAEEAKGCLLPLAEAARRGGAVAWAMGSGSQVAGEASAHVRMLPEPREFDLQAALSEALSSPNPARGLNDLAGQAAAADQVKREQIAYLTGYTATMRTVDGATPPFGTGTAPGRGTR